MIKNLSLRLRVSATRATTRHRLDLCPSLRQLQQGSLRNLRFNKLKWQLKSRSKLCAGACLTHGQTTLSSMGAWRSCTKSPFSVPCSNLSAALWRSMDTTSGKWMNGQVPANPTSLYHRSNLMKKSRETKMTMISSPVISWQLASTARI